MPTKINDIGVSPSRVRAASQEWSTTKRRWPNGRTTAKRNWSAKLREWQLEYEGITLTELNLLIAHHDSAFGEQLTFLFEDPHTATTYTVGYASDELRRESLRPNIRGRYTVKFTLEERR